MAVQLILVQFVEVRILVGQQRPLAIAGGFVFFGSVESWLTKADGKDKTVPAYAGTGAFG